MDPLDYLRALRQRWRLVGLCVAAALLAGWVTTPSNPKVVSTRGQTYQATATLLRDPTSEQSLGYVALFITKGELPEIVAEKLNYPGDPAILAKTNTVTPDAEVGTITIAADGPDGPATARRANAFATEIINYFRKRQVEEKQARIDLLERSITKTAEEISATERAA
ncbi:MAG: hypothetical protein LH624_10075, partial [Cryobacterium sp.]|nr:hypothetical protein [Cryobacterium sp.]